MNRAPRWEYLVGHFGRRGTEVWFESSHTARRALVVGGVRGFADVLNQLGADGWELVHCDDTPPRVLELIGDEAVHAWGDMIFKRPALLAR